MIKKLLQIAVVSVLACALGRPAVAEMRSDQLAFLLPKGVLHTSPVIQQAKCDLYQCMRACESVKPRSKQWQCQSRCTAQCD